MLRRGLVRRRFVEETFCKETFCMCVCVGFNPSVNLGRVMRLSQLLWLVHIETEDGNASSKCNGITRFRFSPILRIGSWKKL